MPPDINQASAAQIEEVQSQVRTQERFEMGSESGEVYHANKHYNELPPRFRKGDPISNYAEAARDVMHTGEVKRTWSEDDVLKYVVHKTYSGTPPGNIEVTLEALVIVRPDGKVVMATFGSPKVVK